MIVLSVVNQKGGCAKTTMSIALASYWAKQGKRVLLLDMDPQHNVTSHLVRPFWGRVVSEGILDYQESDVIVPTIESFISGRHSFIEGIIPTPFGIDVYPSTHYLVQIEKTNVLNILGSINVGLAEIESQYDYVVIDTPPLIENTVALALCSSNFYIVPISADIYAFEGFNAMQSLIGNMKKLMPKPVEFLGCLVTRYKNSHDMARFIKENAKRFSEYRIFDNQFNFSACYEKASLQGQTVYEQLGNTKALLNLNALGQEITSRIGGYDD